jgi:hypothetical protein
MRATFRIATVVALLAAPGCYLVHERGDPGDVPDAATRDVGHADACVVPGGQGDAVDLLLMIDDSTSMSEHQAQLADQLPRIVQALAAGDRNLDGTADFHPPRSLHVGIVDSDMGVGPVTGLPSCDPGFGDDGVLRARSTMPAAGCLPDYDPQYPQGVFAFATPGATSAAQFAADVACVARLGTAGCGIEFELEAPLKALTPAPDATGASSVGWTADGYQPPIFAGNTTGHGSDPSTNGGFLRPDSVLAILTVNDEDDCSTEDYGIFSPIDPAYFATPLNVRCVRYADHLFPVERYVSGFAGLRRDPSRLVFSTITGVPIDLSGHAPSQVLADPRMTPTIDPAQPDRLVPVCMDAAGGQTAVPAPRMVRVADGLRARGVSASVHSICNADFSDAIDDVIARLAGALCG